MAIIHLESFKTRFKHGDCHRVTWKQWMQPVLGPGWTGTLKMNEHGYSTPWVQGSSTVWQMTNSHGLSHRYRWFYHVLSTCLCWAAEAIMCPHGVSGHAKFRGLLGAEVQSINGWFRSNISSKISCHVNRGATSELNFQPTQRWCSSRAPPTTRNQMKPFSTGISSTKLCS